jgi:hypothetical protein
MAKTVGDFIVLVNFKCGRHDRMIDIKGKGVVEVAMIKASLVYDRTKFMMVVV